MPSSTAARVSNTPHCQFVAYGYETLHVILRCSAKIITGVKIGSNGQFIATGSWDKTVCLWRT
jgi:WD40 repeat protein